MLDVLSYLAYNTTPLERKRRAEILLKDIENKTTKPRREFVAFVLDMYVNNGYKELGMDKLSTLLNMKYHSISDAKQELDMNPAQLREFFLTMQHDLYTKPA